MNLGSKIKELRRNKGMLQRELAEILGCSEKAISSYERNYRTPDVNTLNKLSSYFNVSVDYLTKDIENNVVKEDSAVYQEYIPNDLSEIYSLLKYNSNKFTKKQSDDLKDLIKWYIDKNIK